MAMSWKELLLIYLLICAAVVACVGRHFWGDLVFVAEHIIATGLARTPSFTHLAVHLWR